MAVVLYHIDNYLDHRFSGAGLGFVHRGYLGVEFFFILSGFILAHVYGGALSSGRFDLRDYIVKRFARIYPLHLATLIGVAALYAVSTRAGYDFGRVQPLASLAPHAALLHAFGTTSDLFWNQPSWSVSAEFAAYLAFPLAADWPIGAEWQPARHALARQLNL